LIFSEALKFAKMKQNVTENNKRTQKWHKKVKFTSLRESSRDREGRVMTAITSHQCGLDSNTKLSVIFGLNLFLVVIPSNAFSPSSSSLLPKEISYPICLSTNREETIQISTEIPFYFC